MDRTRDDATNEEKADKSPDIESQTDVTPNDADTTTPSTATPEDPPAPTPTQPEEPIRKPKPTFTRVQQPPGGKSSGPLW